MRFLLIFVFFITALSGFAQSSLRFTTIGKGYLSGGGAEGLTDTMLVVKSADQWVLLKSKINKANPESNRFNEKDLDLSKVMIIAVFDSIRYADGYDIEVAGISDSHNERVVQVKHSATGQHLINVIIQPYHIVKVVRTSKPVFFREQKH